MRLDDIGKIYYFAYGHNTNLEEFKKRVPDAERIGTAVLKHFTLTFHHFSNIEYRDNARVIGVLWHIERKSLKDLDHDEGFHKDYTRLPIQVFCDATDQQYDATCYIMDPAYTGNGLPTKEYLNMLLKGYRENHIPLIQLKRALEERKRQLRSTDS
jgi:gamma-glutamylcyclotransferase